MKKALKRLGWLVGDLVTMLLTVAAWFLSPLRLGRLLQTVSIPRMREHRARTSLTVLGVALGVAILIAVKIVSDSVMAGVSATVDNIAGKADLQLSTASSGFDESLLDQIHAVPGVYKATPVVQQPATILAPGANGDRLLMLGVDLLGTEDEYFRDYNSKELTTIKKDSLEFLNSTSNILLSRQVADKFHLKLHDKLSLQTDHGGEEFEIWGFIDGKDGVGRAFGGSLAVMYYPAMQMAFGRGDHIDRVDVAVTPGADAGEVSTRLQTALGGGFNIERPATRGERVSNALAAVKSSLSLASMIAILAGGMLVFNTMAVSLGQRRKELATLQALGTTRWQLVKLFTLEGILIGMVGSATGVVMGLGLSRILLDIAGRAVSRVYVQQAITDVHIRWQALLFGFVTGIITTTLASAIPAYKVSKGKVSETLKAGTAMTPTAPRRIGRADVMAVVLLVAAWFAMEKIPPRNRAPVGAYVACFLVLLAGRVLLPRVIQGVHALISFTLSRVLGMHGRLANDNLPRDLGRTAATTTALMAGVGLTLGLATFNVGFVGSLNTWSAQSVPGDLYVTSGASISGLSSRNMPMEPELGGKIATIEGVEAVQFLRLADYDYQSFPIKLISSDTAMFEKYGTRKYLEGSTADDVKVRHGEVEVSENFSHRFNVHRGDTVKLSGNAGAVDFKVAAVVVDYSSDIGTIRLDRTIYQKYWADDRVDTYELYLKKGVSADTVRAAINKNFGSQYDLFVLTNAEFRGEMLDAADSVFQIMRVLEFLLLVVASLGIINSLLANVLDRIREIGVLRALGMVRKHVAKMVVIEATLIGVVGIVGGAITGIGLGYVIVTHVTSVQTGWYFPYQVPWERLLQIAAIILPIAASAGWYPARQAAALVVRDALDYE